MQTRVPQVSMAKITGIVLGKKEVQEEIIETNFGKAVAKLERTLLQWKTRDLAGWKSADSQGTGAWSNTFFAS